MRQMIINSLETIAYIAIVLVILGSAISGAGTGGFWGFIVGLIGGAIFSIVAFGALFLLIDIADNMRRTARALEAKKDQP